MRRAPTEQPHLLQHLHGHAAAAAPTPPAAAPAATPAAAPAVPPPPAASEVYEVEDMDGDTNAEYTPLAAGAATMAATGLPAASAPLAGGANGAAAAAGEQDMNFLIEEID